MRTVMSFLSEDEVEKIYVASLQVLEKTGIKIGSEKVRKFLARKGAKVDGSIVKLPKSLVEQAIKMVSKEILLAARDSQYDLMLPARDYPFNTTSGYSPFVKDLETGVTRNSTGHDLKEFAVLFFQRWHLLSPLCFLKKIRWRPWWPWQKQEFRWFL